MRESEGGNEVTSPNPQGMPSPRVRFSAAPLCSPYCVCSHVETAVTQLLPNTVSSYARSGSSAV